MKKNLLNLAICLLICLSLALLAGCVSQTKYQSLQTEYSVLQDKYNSLQNENSDLQAKLNTAQAELKLYQDTGIKVYSNIEPDVATGIFGLHVVLSRNTTAHNPTWSELIDFITKDETDSQMYGIVLCGGFAEQVYNNAEKAGIKATFVVINFQEGIGHALNAFNTTDRGLVYIDCTGKGISLYAYFPNSIVIGDTGKYDKVAYIKVGKPIGLISVGTAYGLNYSDYEQWKGDVQTMRDRFNAANANSELYQLKQESDQKLGSFWKEDSSEIIKSIEIYW